MTSRPVAHSSLNVHDDGTFSCAPFVDLTACVRFPPTPDAETPSVLAAAARRGGFGAVWVAPLSEAQGPLDSTVEGAHALARYLEQDPDTPSGHQTLWPVPAPVRGEDLAEIASLARVRPRPAALRLTHPLADGQLMRRVLEMARAQDLLVVVPSFDASLSRGAVAVEGVVATRLGLPALPEAAEAIGIQRMIELARLTRARIHVAHVFTAAGVQAMRQAVMEALPVSACASVTHLAVSERALLDRPYDERFRVWPPLPTERSQAALREAVNDGILCISSGHAPAPKRERDLEMALASPGAATLSHVAKVASALFSESVLVRALADRPAEIAGVTLAGRVRFDLRSTGVVASDDSARGPLDGVATRGAFSFDEGAHR